MVNDNKPNHKTAKEVNDNKPKHKTQTIWSIQTKNYNNSLHQNSKGWAWENKFIAINKYRYKPIQNFVFK